MTVNHLESGIELGSISMGEDAVDNDNRITPPTSVVATPPPVNSDDNSDNISGTDNSNDKNDPPPLNWEQYPESLTNFDPILYDAIQIRRDINQQSQSLFSNLVNLKVTDVTGMYCLRWKDSNQGLTMAQKKLLDICRKIYLWVGAMQKPTS